MATPQKQKVTFQKRKRALLRKAMELSKMCNVDIYLGISDAFTSDNKKTKQLV